MGLSLYEKIFTRHCARQLPSGKYQLFIGLHLLHEVTSPQAFAMLRERKLKVPYPERNFATVDHIIPTDSTSRPLADSMAETMLCALSDNCKEFGIRFFSPEAKENGVVHVVGPEMGLTQPGQTIACGDSHTSTHGAFGSLAFGIGTSQVRDVLATQTLAMDKLKVRRIEISGKLGKGVYAKDVTLHIIGLLGVQGGVGYAYEYAGSVIDAMSMEERMTVCNMAIEGGARIGYCNPDETTFAYLKGKNYSPKGESWNKALQYWKSVASDKDAHYDDVVRINGADIEPQVTWGITPAQTVGVSGSVPTLSEFDENDRKVVEEAYEYMGVKAGQPVQGLPIDVCFIGSCTNGRLSDFIEVARLIKGHKVKAGVKALVVPGSHTVKAEAEKLGLDKIFIEAGFEWREPGCSMCLAMNPDKLVGKERSASSSNRNFKGRQGSSEGRTLLMSPAMVAAAAICAEVADAREVFKGAQ